MNEMDVEFIKMMKWNFNVMRKCFKRVRKWKSREGRE